MSVDQDILNPKRDKTKALKRPQLNQIWRRRIPPQVEGKLIINQGRIWVWEAFVPFQVEYKGRLEPLKTRMTFWDRHGLYRDLEFVRSGSESKGRRAKKF